MALTDAIWDTDTDLTITLASLASDSNLLAGRESTVVVSSNVDDVIDYLLSGQITVGTSPTADTRIEVYVYAQIDDAPTYPDVLDGTDSNETLTNDGVKRQLALAAVINVPAATSNVSYPMRPVSVASLFGFLPERWGAFVVHDTGVNLHATGSNHSLAAAAVHLDIT